MKWSLLLLVVCLSVEVSSRRTYKRKLRVAIDKYATARIKSYMGVKQVECIKHCTGECVSFSYSAADGQCTTYSRRFEDNSSVSTNTSTVYFHKTEQDCENVYPRNRSGVYRIQTDNGDIHPVYCDMDTAGGPWTVIQNRGDGDVDFYRNWNSYKAGFGNLEGNFWLGNDLIHKLTKQGSKLLIQLEAWDGTVAHVEYSLFQVEDEANKYQLLLQGFNGNTINSLSRQNGHKFTTFDQDNDSYRSNCAVVFQGAWWYSGCSSTNLNGPYVIDTGHRIVKSMHWLTFFPGRTQVPLKKSRMLVKRLK